MLWSPEEDEFRKLAFGELPRFTLSDDETIHAFEERSLWQIAPSNDPLFDKAPGDNQILSNDAAPDNQPFVKGKYYLFKYIYINLYIFIFKSCML